jgi:ABC-2 type transport system permease protein
MSRTATSSLTKKIAAELRVAFLCWRTNVRAAMANRLAFVLQVAGMMLNDTAFIAVWLLFFQVVGTVNGWSGIDSFGLLGFATASFGLAFGFCGGSPLVSRYVEDGSMDGFLLAPRSTYVRIITSKSDIAALGDLVFGSIILLIYGVVTGMSLAQIPFVVGMVVAGAVITQSVSMSAQMMSFYIIDAENISFSLFKCFLSPSLYPSGLFPSVTKFIFTFIIPATVVGGLPIEMLQTGSWTLFVTIWAVAIGWLILSMWLFRISVRRYESGNAIGLRSAN